MSKLLFVGGEDVSARIEISKKFLQLGFEIEIIGTQNEDIFLKNKISYQKYSLNRELNIVKDIKTIFELRTILKRQKNGTIVHAFDTKPTMFLPIAAIGLNNIKIVRTITGMGRIFTENSLKNCILKFIYNIIQKMVTHNVDKTIFQNDDDSKYFTENNLIKKENAVTIKSSGLDLSKFVKNFSSDKIDLIKKELNLKFDQKTIILISRMVKQKGILNYLECAKICSENGYKYNFLLVGQLDSDHSIREDEILEYKDYVQYLGRREDIQELLVLSDLFILPTYYREGVPRVLLEASALGLSLITTNMPGCKDVVVDGYNGKLVNIKDSQDIYEKIIHILENKDIESKFSVNAKEKVKEFDLNIIVEKYNEIYKELGRNNANTIS